MTKKERTQRDIDAYKLVIKSIKRGWGADCEEESPEWYTEGGCSSCKAKHAIKLLKNDIRFLRYDL